MSSLQATTPDKNCVVYGGYGEIYVDLETGNVTGSNLLEKDYGRVSRFDIAEFRKHYGLDTEQLRGFTIHIRDVGFWEGDTYTPPEEFYRAEVSGQLPAPVNVIQYKIAMR